MVRYQTLAYKDLESGKTFHASDARQLSFSRDGNFVAAAWGGLVRVWETVQPQDAHLDSRKFAVRSVTLLPGDDDRVTVHNNDGSIRIWSAEAEAPEAAIAKSAEGLQLSPDGRTSVLKEDYDTFHVCDKDFAVVTTYSGVLEAFFAPNSKLIALVSRQELCVVDCTTLECTKLAPRLSYYKVEDVEFSSNSRALACVLTDRRRSDCTLHLWNFATTKEWKKELPQYQDTIMDIVFSPDSTLVAVTVDDGGQLYEGYCKLLEVATGNERGVLRLKRIPLPSTCRFSPQRSTHCNHRRW
ncbi:tricorn protease domain 2-containing protein [Canariomyces notabilis]|uniref:Mitochondrial division protein 1 n=1 Tax=Canariomyces notabilis TaxID=2074819 RepID=A0AAN6QM88_9PEZI|nr:tricorn protease domain 2-containing protein [Canariomyces arenarius]